MRGRERRSWAVRRLLAMSPAEVGLRVFRHARSGLVRPRRPIPQDALPSARRLLGTLQGATGTRGAGELVRTRNVLLQGAVDGEALAGAMRGLGCDPSRVVEAADRILTGRLPAFGWTEIETGPDPDWHRDPGSGRAWPLDYWAEMDVRSDEGLGDPRYVWEVNRHHHLVTLARAHVITRDDIYASAVWRHIRSWIKDNPPLWGVNWASPLEVGIRLISWALALDLVGAEGAAEGDPDRALTSVALQARHISDNLSLYASSKNNHLIGEAAGLLAAGAKFPYLPGARRWAEVGEAVLRREITAQITHEGVDREQAFQYGTFVLELCHTALVSLRALGVAPGERLRDRVRRMGEFLSSVAGPTGVLPAVGDGDGGRAYQLSERGLGRQGIRAAVCASLLCGGTPPSAALGEDLEPGLWLLGPRAAGALREHPPVPAAEQTRRAAYYAEGGYFVAGRGDHHGVIDCGPLGYLSIAAHGHADCLSLAISAGGSWLVVDPGTYCYHREPGWRDHFRSTAAHNTLAVDGASQSQMLGPFLWGRRARPTALCWARSRYFDLFEGEHDGYEAPCGVRHRRAVAFCGAGYWVVADFLEGTGEHDVRAAFQLARGLKPAEGGRTAFDGPAGRIVFNAVLPAGAFVRCAEGSENPREGWVSTGFGSKEPAVAVIAEGHCQLPTAFAFVLFPGVGAGDVEVSGRVEAGGTGLGLTVQHPAGVDTMVFGAGRGARGETFEGKFGFVAERGGSDEAFGIDVSAWSGPDGEVSFEAVPNLLSEDVHGRESDHV